MEDAPPALAVLPPARLPWTAHAQKWLPLLLIAAALAAYWNSFDGAFLLDDRRRIVDNPQIRRFWPWEIVAHSSRPLVNLSLALNHSLGGLTVWGYHAFNLAVHVLAGLTLFGIVRRMFDSAPLRSRYGPVAAWLAAAVALLWLLHPLQTESVTYVIQRAESLMGLFFLLTLYYVIRGAHSPHRRRWYLAAVVASALGMGCKEVMVAAPLVVLLYDRLFLAASFEEVFRRRWTLYAGLAATWLVLAASLAPGRIEGQTVLVTGLSPWRYALTQFGVIVHYLRLSLWPHPLVFDYTWPLVETPAAVLLPAALVAALLAGTLWALLRRAWVGFWGAWFFLILAPTSTILPIADVAVEHRMYLPLAAVVVLLVVGVHNLLAVAFGRFGAPAGLRRWLEAGLVVVVVATLGYATARRNQDYRSDLAMWSDTVAKRPDNPRAHVTLALILDIGGKTDEAIAHYTEALRLRPDYAVTHNNLGVALYHLGRNGEAVTHFTEAVRLLPNYADAENNLGLGLLAERRGKEAIVHFENALRLRPTFAEAHRNLGLALAEQGDTRAAIRHLSEALRLKPSFSEAHYDLGRALASQNRRKEAIAHFESALRLNPGFTEARNELRAAQANEPQAGDRR